MRAAAPTLLALAGCATTGPAPSAAPVDRIGRIYSYVRSDRDGGAAERRRLLLTAHFEGCPQP